MLRGFYSAASGMLYQQKKLNTIANNISNLNTTGYKKENVISTTFEQNFINRLEQGEYQPTGANFTPMVLVGDVNTDYSVGSFTETGRTLDMALEKEGFFVVDVDGKEMLTRNGNFAIDEQGYLVLENVGRVQGYKGDIKLENADFTIAPNGEITNYKDKKLDALLIALPAENVELERQTNGLFATKGGEVKQEDYAVVDMPGVLQGVLERSNVDMNMEITAMIEAQRNFNTVNSALSIVDKLNEKTASLASI